MHQCNQQYQNGKVEQPAAGHGRDQDGERRNGRHLEAPQNVGLALLHGAHAGAPESIAQNAHHQNRGHKERDALAGSSVEHLGEPEEEEEREKEIEEENRPVAHREAQVIPEERKIDFHSRRLFPVSSMNASSSDGRLMRISESSMPWSSSHFTMATIVRAGRREVTAMCVRPSKIFALSASGQTGSSVSPSGCAISISMTELESVLS